MNAALRSLLPMLVAMAWSQRAEAGPGARRPEIDGSIDAAVFVASDYRNSLRDVGFDGPVFGFGVSTRALWRLAPRVRLGPRIGYLGVSSRRTETVPDTFLGGNPIGSLALHLFDAGVVLRLVAREYAVSATGSPQAGIVFDFDAGGVVIGTFGPRGSDGRVVPRLACSIALVVPGGVVSLAMRFGAQYVPSGGAAGGTFWDPAFAGVVFGIDLRG